jgi:hypothetical protein
MHSLRRALLAAVIVGSLTTPLISPADPVETNPFGSLAMSGVVAPDGTTPGRARLTIKNASRSGGKIYFGFRLMGNEDIEMKDDFYLTNDPTGATCTVSDFAGNNTAKGWQGNPAFGTAAGPLGTFNSHMRMIGGFLTPSCGDLVVNITFRTTPLVVFYGAFFGRTAAPWHGQASAPWDTIPTGGNDDYNQWWNLWGTFDTLGYSNACTYVNGTTSCG